MLALQTSRHQGFKEKDREFMLATILCNIKDHDATAIANEDFPADLELSETSVELLRRFIRSTFSVPSFSVQPSFVLSFSVPSFSVQPSFVLIQICSSSSTLKFQASDSFSDFNLQICSQIRSPKIRQPSASIFKIQVFPRLFLRILPFRVISYGFLGFRKFRSSLKVTTTRLDPKSKDKVILKKVKVGIKGAEEFGEFEEWFNYRLSRAAPETCAEFLGSFVADKTNSQFTKGGKWLVWKFEGDLTLGDYIKDRNFP
ncbi:serine/threonine-protein kinase STN8, chloroplastic [Trifolium repens]|nr:serine/threonine-protein kinase STN8, chloroplastic [Trifolium repens]